MTAPKLQFLSDEPKDAVWLVWGKKLHARGVRGARTPVADVLVQLTETAVRVLRQKNTYYYSDQVHPPCVPRVLSIVNKSGQNPYMSVTWQQTGQSSYNPLPPGFTSGYGTAGGTTTYETTFSNGVDTVVIQGSGVDTVSGYLQNYGPKPTGPEFTYTESSIGSNVPGYGPGGTGFGLNTYAVVRFKNANGGTDLLQDTRTFTPFSQTQVYIDLLNGQANNKATLVLLSDGAQIASIPYTNDGLGNKTNYPLNTVWSGDTFIQLFNTTDNGVTWSTGVRMGLSIPADVGRVSLYGVYTILDDTIFHATSGDIPTATPQNVIPAYADVYPWYITLAGKHILLKEWYPPDHVVSFGPPVFAPSNVHFEISSTARARERLRLKTCSDSLKNKLMEGVLDNKIRDPIRRSHLKSTGTKMMSLMTATLTSASAGTEIDATDKLTVTLRYSSEDSDGNLVEKEQVIVGTHRTVRTDCVSSYGAVSYITHIYVNWIPFSPQPTTSGGTGLAQDYTFQLDDNDGLIQMWNGVVVEGAATAGETFDLSGGIYEPPFALSADTRTYSYPDLYYTYRAEVKRRYEVFEGSPNGDRSWLDSAFKDKESITIYPLSVIHADFGDLGMFPQDADITVPSKLKLRADVKAGYEYAYLTGVWTGAGEFILDADEHPAPVDLPYESGVNVVFRSKTTPWPDLVGPGDPVDVYTYAGQAADMAAHPEDYPLFLPLRDL